jgi:ArsR family transcriptional regulator, lead/cadmium/zinc/bismuth-responsive transcriptional repressor
MKKNKNYNICIRNNRDGEQISRCKTDLNRIRKTTSSLSRTYSLIGNEVRLTILTLLLQERMLCVCDLGEILEMTVPAVSQHLKKLRQVGLVYTEREGTTIYYYLSAAMKPMLHTLTSIMPIETMKVA